MKIIDNTVKATEFSSLKVGECFLYDNVLFIKMHPVNTDKPSARNAFCFNDNTIACFNPEAMVMPVTAEVIIQRRGSTNV